MSTSLVKKNSGRGVTNCPHCDSPIFTGKKVAVIGGGNSGIEAADKLAGLAEHVYVLNFYQLWKPIQVLQDRVHQLENVTVLTNVATKRNSRFWSEAITYLNPANNEEQIELSGVFVQIGLLQIQTGSKDSSVALNERGRNHWWQTWCNKCYRNFAAGDCTDSAYKKQIIISMGSETAALRRLITNSSIKRKRAGEFAFLSPFLLYTRCRSKRIIRDPLS